MAFVVIYLACIFLSLYAGVKFAEFLIRKMDPPASFEESYMFHVVQYGPSKMVLFCNSYEQAKELAVRIEAEGLGPVKICTSLDFGP